MGRPRCTVMLSPGWVRLPVAWPPLGQGHSQQSKEDHRPARAGPRQGGPGGLHSPREAPAGRKIQAVAKLGRACWWASTPGGRKGPQ